MSETLGDAQWVSIEIFNKSKSKAIKIKNLSLKYGKFHKKGIYVYVTSTILNVLTIPLWIGDKDTEIATKDIDKTVIQPGNSYIIYSCGRAYSPTGTEGSFDLVEESNDNRLCNFYWDCPWGSKPNKAEVGELSPNWVVASTGFNLDSGALGNGKLTCVDTWGLSCE